MTITSVLSRARSGAARSSIEQEQRMTARMFMDLPFGVSTLPHGVDRETGPASRSRWIILFFCPSAHLLQVTTPTSPQSYRNNRETCGPARASPYKKDALGLVLLP